MNKFDSFFLWIASLAGVGFSVFIGYLKLPWIPYIPVFILIGCAVVIGYLRGAVFSDSFTDRIRGWNYLLLGLAIYVPLTAIKLSEPYLQPTLPNYLGLEPFLTMITILVVVVTYVLISQKITTPAIYKSFKTPYEKVTKKILHRSVLASIFLGITLYNLVLALNIATIDYSIALYFIFILIFAAPAVQQEKRIARLKPLEKFQKYLNIETLEKERLKNVIYVMFLVFALILQIIQLLPQGEVHQSLNVVFSILLIGTAVAFYFSMLHSDRGEIVHLNETAKTELNEEKLSELRTAVNRANGLAV